MLKQLNRQLIAINQVFMGVCGGGSDETYAGRRDAITDSCQEGLMHSVLL